MWAVEKLVEAGIDIHHCDNVLLVAKLQDGRTALLQAARNGHFECMKYLIEKGADIYHQNNVP